jgi:hypothetical protein
MTTCQFSANDVPQAASDRFREMIPIAPLPAVGRVPPVRPPRPDQRVPPGITRFSIPVHWLAEILGCSSMTAHYANFLLH